MYRAYITRASAGELDNTPIIEQVLKLRQEKAQLLGFQNFADLSMASKVRPEGWEWALLLTFLLLLLLLRLAVTAACLWQLDVLLHV